jgi:tetratricopeptide (TPR) repeat protein
MKKLIILVCLLITVVITSCEDYVSNIEPYYNMTKDTDLNQQKYVDGFVVGLQDQLSYTIDDLTVNVGGLSDELLFDMRNSQATFSSYQNTDNGTPMDAEEAAGMFTASHELRQLSDTLIYRIKNLIAFSDSAVYRRGLYNADLYGGIGRYFIASYFGKDQTTGGSPMNLGRFVPSAQLYQDAIAKWKEAITLTTSAYEKKLANSLIARAYLFLGDYANAATFVQLGLVKGDNPLTAKYNATNDNLWRGSAGEVRTQFSVDPRFNTYVKNDPTESARIIITQRTGTGGFLFYRQLKYIMQPDKVTVTPIEVIDWQENNLMKAELVVRGAMAGNALTLINEVRASRIDATTKLPVSALATGTTITLADPVTTTSYSIFVERDKELMLRGNRLIDQRRFGKMHIAGMWQNFPISAAEKARNPLWNQ